MVYSAISPALLAVPTATVAALPAPMAAAPRRPQPASPVPSPVPLATTLPKPLAGPPPDPVRVLDTYVPAHVRAHLEQTYYARVSEQATLDRLVQDPAFLADPARHVALFSDHGIVHVRDIAARLLSVLDTMHGVSMRRRSRGRLEGFMKSYGVLLAYLHDIGMADLSPRGRAAHAAVVAQLVFTPALDAVVEAVWEENSGGIAERLCGLAARGALAQEPTTVWREMLALAMGHSKSSVPRAVLDHPAQLRRLMQETLRTDLRALYREGEAGRKAADSAAGAPAGSTTSQAGPVDLDALAAEFPQARRRFYTDGEREAFAWLVCAHPDMRALVDDVLDTVRALRCADALRQRGTALKTSGAYEVFVEQATAEAVYALRGGPDQLFLLRLSDPLAAGEANLARSWLSRAGNLYIAFQRGAFATPAAVARAARDAAVVVDDIQSDVLGSIAPPRRRLRRDPGHRRSRRGTGHQWNRSRRGAGHCTSGGKDGHQWDRSRRGRGGMGQRAAGGRIVLEGVADNPAFTALVRAQLQRRNPCLQGRVRTTPPAVEATPMDGAATEEARYAAAPALHWDRAHCQAALERIAATGQRVPDGDALAAFAGVKVVALQAGETLIEADTPAAFVYIPLANGLTVLPLGGYPAATVSAWAPVGHTGVIRGAPRNATVVAQRALSLLMLPRDVYLGWWHRPYSAAELRAHLTQLHGVSPHGPS